MDDYMLVRRVVPLADIEAAPRDLAARLSRYIVLGDPDLLAGTVYADRRTAILAETPTAQQPLRVTRGLPLSLNPHRDDSDGITAEQHHIEMTWDGEGI